MTLADDRAKAERLCRGVLGEDYIAQQELTAAFGWQYNHRQINALERTIPTLEVLETLKSRGYVLLPTPSVYCDARMIQGFTKDGSFGYADPDYIVGEVLFAGHWMTFHKGRYPKSEKKTWERQAVLLSPDEYVPGHVATDYVLRVVHYLRGRRLLRANQALRTGSDTCVALDANTDLSMCTVGPYERMSELGVAAAFKLP